MTTLDLANVGAAPDDHTWDPLRTWLLKTNDNLTALNNAKLEAAPSDWEQYVQKNWAFEILDTSTLEWDTEINGNTTINWDITITGNVFALSSYNIRTADDFPVQDATTITLNWVYNIQSTIVTSKRFIIADWTVANLKWIDAFLSWIVYTWTWDMFTFSNVASFSLTSVFITAPISNKLYNCTNASPTWASVFIISSALFDIPDFWIIQNIAQYSWYFNAFTDIGKWMVLESCDIVWFEQSQLTGWKNEPTAMITLDWTMTSFWMNWCPFTTDSNESIFDFKSTLIIQNWTVVWCWDNDALWGSLFALWSKDEKDINFSFQSNSNMPDSIVFGNMYLWTTEQVVVTQNVISIVNDANTWWTNIWTELWDTSRFDFDPTLGRFTYIWIEPTNVEIISTTSLEKQWGWSDYIETLFLLNNIEVIWSAIWTDNNNPTNVTSIWDVVMDTWDYLELAVRNIDSGSNINISVSNFIIKD